MIYLGCQRNRKQRPTVFMLQEPRRVPRILLHMGPEIKRLRSGLCNKTCIKTLLHIAPRLNDYKEDFVVTQITKITQWTL